ncbi:MAG: hypothetical protein KC422_11805 [Trueperaceae bacterium]|nr:hypothetical protein [Trueperaceae bacterium]
MNREMRRAQEKADKKQEQAKERLKAERILKRQRVMQRRQQPRKPREVSPGERKKLPGRFSSLFTAMVAIFIVMQSIIPPASDQNQTLAFVINVLYYFMFGYFMYLWLARIQFKQALNVTIGAGIGLTLALLGAQFAIPGLSPEFRLIFFAIPAVILGTFIAQFIFNKAP